MSSIREASRRSFQQVVATIASLSEHDLFDPQGCERIIGRSIREIIAANTYEHYQEHGAVLHAWITRLQTATG